MSSVPRYSPACNGRKQRGMLLVPSLQAIAPLRQLLSLAVGGGGAGWWLGLRPWTTVAGDRKSGECIGGYVHRGL